MRCAATGWVFDSPCYTLAHAHTQAHKSMAFARSKGAVLTKFPNTSQRLTTQSMTTGRTGATQITTSDN